MVSRTFEKDYYRYYGLPPYWDGAEIWGIVGSPATIPGECSRGRHRPRAIATSMSSSAAPVELLVMMC